MASLGHIAVGLAAGRRYATARAGTATFRAMLAFSALSMLPDADVIGFKLGIRYADPWGHRGASHSLLIAVCVGLACGVLGRTWRLPFWRTTGFAALTVASHGLLDALTDGGRGIALAWPVSIHRFFAPWRPIPVAPIGLGFMSSAGLRVAVWELGAFAPFTVYALWPRRKP